MSKLGKLFFCLTSLAPCAFAYAVNLLSRGLKTDSLWWFAIGALLGFVCWGIVKESGKRLEHKMVHTTKVKLADKEILAFLLAYLLPLASTATLTIGGDLLTASFVYFVIALCIYHSNAFTFNPILAFFGYHFFEIENEESMTYLLLSKRSLHSCKTSLEVVSLGEYLYLDVGA